MKAIFAGTWIHGDHFDKLTDLRRLSPMAHEHLFSSPSISRKFVSLGITVQYCTACQEARAHHVSYMWYCTCSRPKRPFSFKDNSSTPQKIRLRSINKLTLQSTTYSPGIHKPRMELPCLMIETKQTMSHNVKAFDQVMSSLPTLPVFPHSRSSRSKKKSLTNGAAQPPEVLIAEG